MGEILQNDILLVKSIIKKVLDADEYEAVERLGGLTNHTYHVTIKDGKEYVIRLPGEGTQKLINRQNERISTSLPVSLRLMQGFCILGRMAQRFLNIYRMLLQCQLKLCMRNSILSRWH